MSEVSGSAEFRIAAVHREIDPQTHTSELLVLDAMNIGAPPVARVPLPVALHPQIHGCWVSAGQLAASKLKG